MTPRKKLRVIGYVRVSDRAGRGGDRYIAPTTQREAIERFVDARGHELTDVVTDENHSGGTLDRPGLQQVLAALEAGEADAIAVGYLSRLSRRVIDGLGVVQRLNELGRHVLIADLDLDSSTPTGKAMLAVALAFAELELDQRRAGWAEAQRKAMERGVYPGTTPIGYSRDDDGVMVPDPLAAPVVKEVFERRAAGESWSSLARLLDAELPRPNGERWRPATVRHVLDSQLYLGRLERTVGGERIVVEDAHQPLIGRPTWEAANASKGHGPKHRAEPAMLAGIATCASCGGSLTRGGYKRNGRQYDSYVCSARCERMARISAPLLDGHVLTLVEQRLAVSEAVDAKRGTRDGLRRLETELERAEQEERDYHEATSASEIGPAAYGHGARVRAEAVAKATQALAEAASRERVAGGRSHRDLLDWLASDEATDGKVNVELRRLLASVVVARATRPGRQGDLHKRVAVRFRGDDLLEGAPGLGEDVGRERAQVAA
jgi:site-specific DNA recombinase